MKLNKKKVISMALATATLLSSSVGVFAANRDFHTKDGSKTYEAKDWGRNPAVFEQLLEATILEPGNLTYEFNGVFYDYEKFSNKMNAATGDINDAFAAALEDESLIYGDSQLKVELVSAITNQGVTVEYAALTEDMLGETVEVKDANGTVYEVKSADLAEGTTSYTFEFVTTVPTAKLVGNWTVNGVTFNLDLASNLKAFNDAGTDQIKLNKALSDLGIENVKVENMKAYADAHSDFLAKLAKDNEDLSVANIQAFINEVNAEQITAEEGKEIVKKVNDAIAADNDIALLQALQNEAFVRVNPDWLTGTTSYKATISAESTATNKDEVKEIQGFIDTVNTSKVGAATDTGINKTDLLKAKDVVVTYNTPNAKGEMTTTTKTKLGKINTQLALVNVLEATTPNNFKAKLADLAALVDDTSVLDMKDYVDANGQAYIDALNDSSLADTDIDTVSEVEAILFGATTGVNDVEEGNLITAVTGASTANELVKALNDLGVKQVADTNKDAYLVYDAPVADSTADYTVVTTKAEAQELVDAVNLDEAASAAEADVLEKLNVFGIDNIIAANAKAYATDTNSDISGVTADTSGDNAETVKDIKAAVAAVNKSVTVAAQVKAINEATTVAEVKTALDELANVGEAAGYLTVRSADREFVAAHVLEERPVAPGYADESAIQGKIGANATVDPSALKAHQDALDAVNAITRTTSPAAVVDALDKVLDEDFAALTAVQKSAKAQEFQDKLTFDDAGDLKVDFVTLAAVKALLK